MRCCFSPAIPGFLLTSFFNIALRHMCYLCLGCCFSSKKLERECKNILRTRYDFPKRENPFILFSYSCRTAWDLFIQHLSKTRPKKKKIITTALLHTGYQRVVNWYEYEEIIIPVHSDGSLGEIPDIPGLGDDCATILITHLWGCEFTDMRPIFDFAEKNNIPVFEDCVQGGYITQCKGNPRSTVITFSGGMDKMPVSFGGGFSSFRDEELYKGVKKLNDKLPKQPIFGRFQFLLGKLMHYSLQSFTPGMYLFFWVGYFIGLRSYEFGLYFRKNIHSGFTHAQKDYFYSINNGHWLSIRQSLLRYKDYRRYEKQQHHKRALFIKTLGERIDHFLPWGKNLNIEKASNFYYHVYVNDIKKTKEVFDDMGWMVVEAQSFYVDKECKESHDWYYNNVVLIPHIMNLDDKGIVKMGEIFRDVIDVDEEKKKKEE